MSPTKKRSSRCCIGGDPPSPDGLAPRPATRVVESEIRKSTEQVPSWTTTDAAQIQAIFEEDAITPLAEDARRVKPQHGMGKLVGILEGEKSDSDIEMKVLGVKGRKSSSTLKSVTKRLKKHLSRESALSKRHSRSSVGTSEEEIERRAELRRIRERRIREELSNEGVYDEDAKSISTISSPHTPLERAGLGSWSARKQIPSSTLAAKDPIYPAVPLPSLSSHEQ